MIPFKIFSNKLNLSFHTVLNTNTWVTHLSRRFSFKSCESKCIYLKWIMFWTLRKWWNSLHFGVCSTMDRSQSFAMLGEHPLTSVPSSALARSLSESTSFAASLLYQTGTTWGSTFAEGSMTWWSRGWGEHWEHSGDLQVLPCFHWVRSRAWSPWASLQCFPEMWDVVFVYTKEKWVFYFLHMCKTEKLT